MSYAQLLLIWTIVVYCNSCLRQKEVARFDLLAFWMNSLLKHVAMTGERSWTPPRPPIPGIMLWLQELRNPRNFGLVSMQDASPLLHWTWCRLRKLWLLVRLVCLDVRSWKPFRTLAASVWEQVLAVPVHLQFEKLIYRTQMMSLSFSKMSSKCFCVCSYCQIRSCLSYIA